MLHCRGALVSRSVRECWCGCGAFIDRAAVSVAATCQGCSAQAQQGIISNCCGRQQRQQSCCSAEHVSAGAGVCHSPSLLPQVALDSSMARIPRPERSSSGRKRAGTYMNAQQQQHTGWLHITWLLLQWHLKESGAGCCMISIVAIAAGCTFRMSVTYSVANGRPKYPCRDWEPNCCCCCNFNRKLCCTVVRDCTELRR